MNKKLRWNRVTMSHWVDNRQVDMLGWIANVISTRDIKVDILIAECGNIGDKYYRICLDENTEGSIMEDIGDADTLKAAKELAQKECDLFWSRNNDN
jgi:hypothetical protein